ncbi:TonB-dependent receptor [Longimicrobium terrae]|uniref:TonB-dependent transporter Oar-like beta-barrel domain-containing protein n=1 Tax=Longimicrobium terrae TaxID=1639882 RepID=A0A841GQL7_9BACT|nr:TonB-dependent receptor [Longimicrobium terrae]MBB4635408.1 hypothetical protein [Longimicrobium terrae]MBB6069802.1 hypothetical protein [Longimicrobium terrae]NNC30989.1 TonB-dependent receptor [Longimicrobium terrae]
MTQLLRSMLHRARGFACAAILLTLATLAGARTLHAQAATLQGRVTDPTGAPVVAALVDLNQSPGTLRRNARTDATGAYRIVGLPTGRYTVSIRRSGYQTGRDIVLLAPGETLQQDFVIESRPVMIDTVTVVSDNDVSLDRTQTGFDTRVTETAIELLPLAQDPSAAVALTPGARGAQVFGGATAQANQYQIDGLAANHPGVGGDLVQPSLNWLEAVQVRGLGAAAEYGNFQGGLVNLITKSGSNDFQGEFTVRANAAALTASNLQRYDVNSEIRSRYDVEGELRGPIIRNRLFYYLGGQVITREDRVPNNLITREGFYAPFGIQRDEQKLFGKLSWQPTGVDQLMVSGGYLNATSDGIGSTGYEPEPLSRMTAPTTFGNARYERLLGPGRAFQISAATFERDERREPAAGEDRAAVVLYGLNRFQPTFLNAPFRSRQAPSSATVQSSLTWEIARGGMRHSLKAGGEYSAGTWIDQRLRNGGMTWRPSFGRNYSRFNPDDAFTWGGVVPTEWGGEVNLNADVRNAAVYLQDNVEIGPRLTLAPGIRYGWWEGYITPAGDVGPRFRAMQDAAPDFRLGATWDVTGRNDLVVKAHAGRYHQSMFAQFYERVAGGNVFSDRETWYYGARPTSIDQRFTQSERDQLAQTGVFRLQEAVRLNQTGPVDPGYRQPYVDEFVLGAEKQLGRFWKAELVYVNRQNRNMVALVDRNAATNYTAFDNIAVFGPGVDQVEYLGRGLRLDRVYVPNNLLIEFLTAIANDCQCGQVPPGLTLADRDRLTWNPDLVITNAPGAERSFHQIQGVVRFGYPRFGGVISAVYSRLRGNLDNVGGYDETGDYSAGQFVNPNQSVNATGLLPNSSPMEIKTWVYGSLPAAFRGGLLFSWAGGDRYTPRFELSPALYSFFDLNRDSLSSHLFFPSNGQPVFVETRGAEAYPERVQLDLHLERGVRMGPAEWVLELDGINVLGQDTPIAWNTSVNQGLNYRGDTDQFGLESGFYRAVRDRVPPRSLRLGATVRF